MKHRKTKKFLLILALWICAFAVSYYFYDMLYDTHRSIAHVIMVLGGLMGAFGGDKTGKLFDEKYPQS